MPPPPIPKQPTSAPGGRSGDTTIDTIIEALLSEDAAALRKRSGSLAASEGQCSPECSERRIPNAAWTERFSKARKSLYAIYASEAPEVHVVLAVDGGGVAAENWQFGIDDGKLVEVRIRLPPPYLLGDQQRNDFLYFLAAYTPYLPQEYARYYVLPPEERLPKPPAFRPLNARTGDPGVDRLLEVLESGDAARLRAAIDASESVFLRYCSYEEGMDDPGYLDRWAVETAGRAFHLHAVARLPADYPVEAEHVIILVSELNPLSWGAMGLFERDGAIVAIASIGCSPRSLYPPSGFLLPPAPEDQPLDRSRRAPSQSVMTVLDAIWADDEVALGQLIDYPMVECGPGLGIGSPPPCPPGVDIGTQVEALTTGCHGDYSSPSTAPREVIRNLSGAALYAVVEARDAPGAWVAILAKRTDPSATKEPPFTYGIAALVIEEGRLIDFQPSGCGAQSMLSWLARNAQPNFLLPPPPP